MNCPNGSRDCRFCKSVRLRNQNIALLFGSVFLLITVAYSVLR
jgi:hypothetical protein